METKECQKCGCLKGAHPWKGCEKFVGEETNPPVSEKTNEGLEKDVALLKDERVQTPKLYSFDQVRKLLVLREVEIWKQFAERWKKITKINGRKIKINGRKINGRKL